VSNVTDKLGATVPVESIGSYKGLNKVVFILQPIYTCFKRLSYVICS